MDFSSRLSQEIARKRQAKKGNKKQKTEPMVVSDPTADLPKEEILTLEQTALLEAVSAEKLQKSLEQLNEDAEKLSKAEQLQTLEIVIKTERKNERYQQYLEAENAVDPAVALIDIAGISEPASARKLSLQVRRFIKEIIKRWEASPDLPPYTKALLTETKRDLVKLLYKLRSDKLKPDMLVSLSTIVLYIQSASFVQANESYMKLSIGNVAWPIGIRDVGIHARAALLKITGDDKSLLANIMQNEHTRRWIIAVKRLISYSEHLNTERKTEEKNKQV